MLSILIKGDYNRSPFICRIGHVDGNRSVLAFLEGLKPYTLCPLVIY